MGAMTASELDGPSAGRIFGLLEHFPPVPDGIEIFRLAGSPIGGQHRDHGPADVAHVGPDAEMRSMVNAQSLRHRQGDFTGSLVAGQEVIVQIAAGPDMAHVPAVTCGVGLVELECAFLEVAAGMSGGVQPLLTHDGRRAPGVLEVLIDGVNHVHVDVVPGGLLRPQVVPPVPRPAVVSEQPARHVVRSSANHIHAPSPDVSCDPQRTVR